MRRNVLTLAALALCGAVGAAQSLPTPPEPRNPKGLALPSILYDAWLARGESPASLRARFDQRLLRIDERGRALVAIDTLRDGAPIDDAWLAAHGAQLTLRSRELTEAWLPVARLVDAARGLPPGYTLQPVNAPTQLDVTGEGPLLTKSAGWRDGGADGAGLTIAVIDSSWAGLDMAVANGDAPANAVKVNYDPSSPFQSGTNVHGTGCLETVFDHAPGASYRLYRITTAGGLASAIDNCILNGVDVISHSLGWFNESWEDDEGQACDAANLAAASGIVFVTSAGNHAQRHWQGQFTPGSGNAQWHDWVSGDEGLQVTIQPGDTVRVFLSWDDAPSGSEDYDLFLLDQAGLIVLASSTNPFEYFESVSWTNNGAMPVVGTVGVWRDGGAVTEFEVFVDDATCEYFVSAGSTVAPTNASHYRVIAVGAVDWTDYLSLPGTSGIITDYSSRGPSNGGMSLPDLVGPTATTTFSYGGAFTGTSCSAPNVAGMIACLWSSTPAYSAESIAWLTHAQALYLLDWGAAGNDTTYGRGGANLVPFAPHTRWMTAVYSNPSGSATGPTNNLTHAQAQTPTGGRVVILPGGVYPQAPVTLTKPLTFVSYGADAVCGD